MHIYRAFQWHESLIAKCEGSDEYLHPPLLVVHEVSTISLESLLSVSDFSTMRGSSLCVTVLCADSVVLYDFLGTVKAAPHEYVIRTGQP